MSFWKKFANVASGGMLGMAQGIKNRDMKAVATGGMMGGSKGGARRGVPATAEARAFFQSQSPEDQASIMETLRGNPNGMNEWFQNAKAAGSVPQNTVPQNIIGGGDMMMRGNMAKSMNPAIMEAVRRRMGSMR